MDSVGLSQNENSTAEKDMYLLYTSLPEPTSFPRIGEQYQARIPPLLTEEERLQERQKPASVDESPEHDEISIESGGFIPIKWLNEKGDQQNQVDDEQTENTENAQLDPVVLFTPMPSSGENSWGPLEEESFLLSLYIFGKDLVQVKAFMDEKKYNNILLYYYGNFYGSDSFKKWTKGKKIQRKKCGRGKKLFTDQKTLRKFLERILPLISKEAKSLLLKAADSLNEKEISMEYFVSTVRSYVGLEIFVNAVGIGKGKCDLTTFAFKQVKKKKKIISVPRVTRRKSKAFSSFTSGDIINYLTGGSRLSKTKSSDLFWEAVWPCLVAKGWNSMNIKGNLSKNHLVFLVPGIKMFSKKIHKKGTHYFDSISDILNKVAAEPSLLEQNAECSKGKVEGEPSTRKPRAKASKRSKNTNGENFNPPVAKKKRSVAKRSKKKQRLSSEPEKITVVDTSAAQGEEGVLELTQLRTLPIMKKGNSKGLCLSSAKPATQPMNENNLCDQVGKVYSRKMKSMVSDVPGPSSKRRRLASFHHVITHPQPVLIVAQAKTHIVNVEPAPEMPALSPFTDKVTAENAASRPILDLNMPTIEVNVAIIDLNMPIIDVNVPIIDLDMPSIDVNMPIIDLNMPSIDVNMPIIDLNMPSIDGNVPIIDLNMPVIVDDLSPPLMDLNIPPLIDLTVLPDIDLNSTPPAPEPSDAAETLLAEACQGLLDLNSSPEEGKGFFDLNSYPDEEESQPEEQEQLLMDSQVVEEANVELSSPMPAPNARRQSTRTRPPTLKAIEAAAYGYISPERSERAMKAPKLSSASSKGSRQATKKKGSKLM